MIQPSLTGSSLIKTGEMSCEHICCIHTENHFNIKDYYFLPIVKKYKKMIKNTNLTYKNEFLYVYNICVHLCYFQKNI